VVVVVGVVVVVVVEARHELSARVNRIMLSSPSSPFPSWISRRGGESSRTGREGGELIAPHAQREEGAKVALVRDHQRVHIRAVLVVFIGHRHQEALCMD